MDEWTNEFGTWRINPRRSAGDSETAGWDGVERRQRGPREANVRVVRTPPIGMTADDLFQYQRTFTHYAAKRLLGVGAQQYDRGGEQKFERMTVDELVTGLREELADIINYATMIDIQLARWAERTGSIK